jgi:hypothetical protein
VGVAACRTPVLGIRLHGRRLTTRGSALCCGPAPWVSVRRTDEAVTRAIRGFASPVLPACDHSKRGALALLPTNGSAARRSRRRRAAVQRQRYGKTANATLDSPPSLVSWTGRVSGGAATRRLGYG